MTGSSATFAAEYGSLPKVTRALIELTTAIEGAR